MHCRDWVKKGKKEMGSPAKEAGVVIPGKHRWWFKFWYYLSGDRIYLSGDRISRLVWRF